ncbi:DUF3300 domain-containing protein [uncultured Piscinibacter sp.]|uniref:DUF3300 domain-containing protein n=1 Tax=uncultured Piscinibacter sp. TaxID=1131835 RepID=UPI00261247D4|nr:DUF3300 domain-containing protein [uncultured Piscinibacter sp.]
MAIMFPQHSPAQAPAAVGGVSAVMSAAELENLVAPIALYPDDLVAIILPASTNPLQLVQAGRYLDNRKSDPKLAVNEGWDDPVKSLLNYPEVVHYMSKDLDWTAALGEAVVASQADVLEAIQAFRRRTYSVGNLKTDTKQVIVVEKEVIKIVPANPQVIYVPQYNPTTVIVQGGYSSWSYWPSPYPVYYYPYPPGAAFAAGLVWGAAISSAWRGHHYVAHYGGYGRQTYINVNVNRNVTVNRPGIPAQRPSASLTTGQVSTLPATTQWRPNKQPGQVSGAVGRPAPRVGDRQPTPARKDVGASPVATPATPTAAAKVSAPQQRAAAVPSPGRAAPGSAFDASGSGRQAQLDSARGAASRETVARQGQAPAGSARPVAPQRPTGGARPAAPQGRAGADRDGTGRR